VLCHGLLNLQHRLITSRHILTKSTESTVEISGSVSCERAKSYLTTQHAIYEYFKNQRITHNKLYFRQTNLLHFPGCAEQTLGTTVHVIGNC
jgi:hypothetical protein